MRLSPQQTETIKIFTQHHFGEDAEVWLFGSRVNNEKRGGAIMTFSLRHQLTNPT